MSLHREKSETDSDEGRVGEGMPGVWLLSVVVLPAFFVFWRILEEVVEHMIMSTERL